MLMCLSSLGGFLAEALQCAYSRLCRRQVKQDITDDDTDADEYGDVWHNRSARSGNDEVSTGRSPDAKQQLTNLEICNCRPTAICVDTTTCAK